MEGYFQGYTFSHFNVLVTSITEPQDAHKLVLQVAEWLNQTRVNYITFSTSFKKIKSCHAFTIVCKGREPIAVAQRLKKVRERKVLPHVEDRTLTVRPQHTAKNNFIGYLALYIAPT